MLSKISAHQNRGMPTPVNNTRILDCCLDTYKMLGQLLFPISIQELSLRYQATHFRANTIERPQYMVSLPNRSGSGEQVLPWL